ncbi:MAG: AAA family ATPase [Thermoplasmata archaeon]|nr:AAA family ATPase [Thermoplasmata archaeon]MCI4340812.1 AAA family ATPase [Thermoplasmata archaeon]
MTPGTDSSAAVPTTAPDRSGPAGDPEAARLLAALQQYVGLEVIGYQATVRQLLVALLAEGHVLLEGVPGIAKTMLAHRFASALSLSFKRIQFAPDMLPSDIAGNVILNPANSSFEYRPGPVFANVVLADEINRAPPKVQSALLEAMQERQVTVDGVTHPLPRPFLVIATQNPIEQEGTYPLPEAQIDRFLFRLLLGYPGREDEIAVLERHGGEPPPEGPTPSVSAEALLRLHARALRTTLSPELLSYVVTLLRSTREDPRILMGGSPRAGVQFVRAAKASALLAGRGYVTPDDIKSAAFDVLNHRILLHPDIVAQRFVTGRNGLEPLLREVLKDRMDRIEVPR